MEPVAPGHAPGKEDDLIPGTSLVGLGAMWEEDELLRGRALRETGGSLLSWPQQKLVGVITFQTLSHNAKCMAHVLEKWCPQVSEPKTVNIDQVRAEDRLLCFLGSVQNHQ